MVAANARNEASLRHGLENALERHAKALEISWVPFQFEVPVGRARGSTRFVDVAHGGVVIEYEAPGTFRGKPGAALTHAQEQAADYAQLLQAEEGRPLKDYTLIAWDGSHISFGRFANESARWERVTTFGLPAAERLLRALATNGVPLVHPLLLATLVGPESEHGSRLIPLFYQAVRKAAAQRVTTKTRLLFTEWRRLFGQVAGVQSARLRELLARQGRAHGRPYDEDPAAYLFALNTHIALVAKLVSALSLPKGTEDISDAGVPIFDRLQALESGRVYRSAGILNMLAGDFFSWYLDDASWPSLAPHVEALLTSLGGLSFDFARKSLDTTRDLFKGMYQSFVPRALRHALGEYYTPDWLAAHALDVLRWTPNESLLDPSCGSGTFILEAVRRRLVASEGRRLSPRSLLQGLYGIDLNPLAVLAARASLVVSIAPLLGRKKGTVVLPIYLADAINPAEACGSFYRHTLQTELGPIQFAVPRSLVESPDFAYMVDRLRDLVETGWPAKRVLEGMKRQFSEVIRLKEDEQSEFLATIEALVRLYDQDWDGIWCAILGERFAAGSIPRVRFIAGNPPWVKWSNLPPEYASFIKPHCLELGVFSQDRWVGGIESDISTVITYEAVDHWLDKNGRLAFFITGTIFANESSQGFRRFELPRRGIALRVEGVEDFSRIAPFEGVSNHATLLILHRDQTTRYPVRYRMWNPVRLNGTTVRSFKNAGDFRRRSSFEDLRAQPVPGTDAGPWLKGSSAEHELWERLFERGARGYVARKGITTDRNGIFFVKVVECDKDVAECSIRNEPALGKTRGIPKVEGVVEARHLYPLLRGRGLSAFSVLPDQEYRALLPQRGMHGDPDLPTSSPLTHRFLSRFKAELERRSSYRRFQAGQPWWSIWSTGPYTFSPFKVFWREMPGGRFVAAYVGPIVDPVLGERVVVPDHKLYFVPVDSLPEAAYLTAFLNAPLVSRAVSAYAAQLSLGVSVVEYLAVPRFELRNRDHAALAAIGQRVSREKRLPSEEESRELDRLALSSVAR